MAPGRGDFEHRVGGFGGSVDGREGLLETVGAAACLGAAEQVAGGRGQRRCFHLVLGDKPCRTLALGEGYVGVLLRLERNADEWNSGGQGCLHAALPASDDREI